MMIGKTMLLLAAALGLMALALTAVVLVAVWVYRDARSRGLEAWVWTLVTVLVPSFIGLLLYFLVGRKEARRPCPACARAVPERSAYCAYCGARMPEELPARPLKSPGKALLITGLVCLGLTIVLGFGSIIALAAADGAFSSVDFFSVSTVYVENNLGDQWSVSFHYTNKSPDTSFKIGEEGPHVLYFSGKCEEGPLTLRVWQEDVERTFDLSGGEQIEGSLDLSVFGPGKVFMELDHNRGEGRNVEFKARWENGAAPVASPTPAPAETAPLAEEAGILIETIEASHPAFGLDAVPTGYEEAKAALLETANDPDCTTAAFAWAALAYTTSLHDGHTRVDVFGGTPQSRLDLGWYADGDRLYLTEGGEVTAVGGLTVKELFDGVDRYFAAENQAGRDQNHSRWAGTLPVLALLGAELEKDYSGTSVRLVDGTERAVAFIQPGADAAESVISTELLDDVFYVDFNQCMPGPEMDGACEALGRAVKDGVEKVIIDVRGNGGGDSSTCERLLEAMGMAAPAYGGYLRYSPLAREQRGYDKAQGGERQTPRPDTANANPDVDLVVLSDEATFSSATMLCVMVRDGKLGTIIGRTSANAPNSYGDMLSFRLPATGMTATTSHKQWLRPDENADPDTVTPDIVTIHGEDSLAAALEFLARP